MGAREFDTMPPGSRVGDKYVIRGHLGSGGMGDVYEVEHQLLHRRFALKRLAADKTEERSLIERFMREARAAAATGHPGIVEVFDLGFADEGWPFLVMEKLEGESLRARIRRGALPLADTVRIAGEILDALAAVHAKAIVHRDIKPENIFLATRGAGWQVKLLDFGLARLGGDHTDLGLTQTGAVMGTPLYMSPEQARGEEVDLGTDLYAVGAVLYECVCGRPPFVAQTYGAVVAQVLEQAPDATRLEPAPAPMRAAILRALAKRRSERFADAAHMRAAITGEADLVVSAATLPDGAGALVETAQTIAASPHAVRDEAGPPIATAPTTMSGERERPAPRPSRRWMAIAACACALGIGAAVYLTRGSGEPPPAEVAPPADDRRIDDLLATGQLEAASDLLRRASLRAPGDLELRARYLMVLLEPDRERAFEEARALAGDALPPRARAIVDGILAFETGALAAALPAIEREADAAPGDLALQFLRATLLRYADRWDEMRAAHEAILARWPAFGPAVDGLLQRLLLRGMITEARAVVDAYVAAAPDSRELERLEIELLIGERQYRKAADHLERVIAAHPAREAELYQFRGDLRLLEWDTGGAIAAYDRIGAGPKRDHYVFGALLHAGKGAEARALLLGAIEGYPEDAKRTRLAKLGTDAALLALETGDRELAARTAARLERVPVAERTARFAGGLALARVAAGGAFDSAAFPHGEASPYVALLRARTLPGTEVLALLEPHLDGAQVLSATVSTHVYPPIYVEAARGALEAGQHPRALELTDAVLRPRHYDGSRGIVVRRAMELRARTLAAMGRAGEAQALERELAARFGL